MGQMRHGVVCAGTQLRRNTHGTITVGQEKGTPIELYYEDHGAAGRSS